MNPATIKQLLADGAKQFERVSDSVRLDANLLLAHALDKPRSYLLAHADETPDNDARQRYASLVERRATGEPVAYILGHQEFWSLRFDVCDAVLIPRPETETLVTKALEIIPEHEPWRMADLGTGSGAIAVAVASERPHCEVVATDISTAALAMARDNAQRHHIENIELRQGNWLEAVSEGGWEMIVSNPPYVSENDPHLDAPSMQFEPRQALIAPANGLRCLREIIEAAPPLLTQGGWLLLEHGANQAEFVTRLMAAQGFINVATATDLAGHPRVSYGHLLDRVA